MRLKRPHAATFDEVTITREDDGAVIAYKDPTVRTTHFRLGPGVHQVTAGSGMLPLARRGDDIDHWGHSALPGLGRPDARSQAA